MKLLMHLCCSNCSIYPLQNLLLKGIDVTGFWFNPNIHPFTEYSERLASLRKLQGLWNFDVEYDDDYALDSFLKAIAGRDAERCSTCYEMRLDRTAEAAKKMHFDGFSTSLLVSPYQKFDKILEKGKDAAVKHDIEFYCEDFRPGFYQSKKLSKELDLYRQKYCGCIYSEMERYNPRRKEQNKDIDA